MQAFMLILMLAAIESVPQESSQAGQPQISPEARKYLAAALSIIEDHSIKKKTDWQKMREAAFDAARGAKTPAEAHAGIRAALAVVNDHHSFLIPPERDK